MKGIYRHKAIALALGAVLGAGTLVGCSDSETGSTASSTTTDAASAGDLTASSSGATLVGVFRDAPVSGLHFWSPSHHGYTDADGKFNYVDGEEVDFSVGNVKFGGAQGKGVITPMDLMAKDADSLVVQAIARTLLQLDEDGDARGGIQLNDELANVLKGKLQAAGIDELDFDAMNALLDDDDASNDGDATAALDTLYTAANETAEEVNGNTIVVTYEDAVDHLLTSDLMFRKNISKTPDLASAKAKFNIMPSYVPAMRADEVAQNTYVPDTEGSCEIGVNMGGVCKTKPLVATYIDVDWRYGAGAGADAFAAVSRDDGLTWKRTNLSRTGNETVTVTDSSGATVVEFPGESRKPVMQVKSNKILVAWSDKYCSGGSPRYSVDYDPADGVKDEVDIYGVAGHQGYVDYTADSTLTADRIAAAEEMVGGVVVPYSCIWSARGWIDNGTGAIQWGKAERLTSGRRDAYQLFVGAGAGAGMGITWQEDPGGLEAGSGDGPGHGFSGAKVNHKTDVWYSYITDEAFTQLAAFEPAELPDDDANEPANPDLLEIGEGGEGLPRVRVARMSMPVRITDNAVCNLTNLTSEGHKWCRLTSAGIYEYVDGQELEDLAAETLVSVGDVGSVDISSLGLVNCDKLVQKESTDEEVAVSDWTCMTADGVILDGDTGASRPNLFMQPFTKPDGTKSAWAILAYEETKGLGTGPDSVDVDAPDIGKNVYYHSFEFSKPDVLAAGGVVNLPERDVDGNLIVLNQDLLDAGLATEPHYATENARRIRFILQGKKPSLGKDTDGDGIGDTGAGTSLLAIYKQGPSNKGRPSDIFLRRMTVRNEDGTVKTGNPYAYENFICDETDTYGNCIKGARNMSSVSPTLTVPPDSCGSEETCYDKLVEWTASEDNFDDESWETPMTESRAHRGQIRGDFVVMGYAWTPNWAAARNGNDKYDFFVRRSFDGGVTWTTGPKDTEHCKWSDPNPDVSGDQVLVCATIPAGAFEPPRNVSLLKNNKETVIEPRIVAVPGSITCAGTPCTPEDKQNTNVFLVSYGLANNSDDDGDGEVDSYPTDMFITRSTDKGASYPVVEYPSGEGWDWLAMRDNVEEGEAQLRLTPDGQKAYATWLAESGDDYDGPEHFEGSDIWFRKFDYNVEVAE